MKVKFLHWYNALAATLLSLLGFSSCGEIGNEEPCLYGSPTSSFHAKGNVADEDGTPIKGIKAVVVEDYVMQGVIEWTQLIPTARVIMLPRKRAWMAPSTGFIKRND